MKSLSRKSLSCFFTIITLSGLAACVTHTRDREIVRDRPSAEREVVVVDPHRGWWDAYHRDEAYDRDRALESHRMWCDEHPTDASCSGWYSRH
jgi:hypothetical protein